MRRKWLTGDASLHYCTNAKNTAQNLPLFAKTRGVRWSIKAEQIAPHVKSLQEDLNWGLPSSGGAKISWHGHAQKWQCELPVLFTMSGQRAGDQDGGRRAEDEYEQGSG
jgi:hypothetical protein